MGNKNKKAENFCQVNKEKLQKRWQKYYRNLSQNEKIKKRNYENIKNKNMLEGEYLKNYYNKGKKLANYLINRVEE